MKTIIKNCDCFDIIFVRDWITKISLVGKSLIEVRFLVDYRNCIYFLDFDKVVSEPLVNSDPLTLKFSPRVILVRRYSPVHVSFLINVSKFVIFDVFLPGVRTVLVVL